MPLRTATRRQFLQRSAAAAALPYIMTGPLRAADGGAKNDRPVIGAIGMGGRGRVITRNATALGDLVAVCDVDAARAESAKEQFGGQADVYGDYRALLDRPDIDAVVIGTPDHWHTPIALYALRAGKDVYCEKPLTLTVAEGPMLIRAVEETGRVFQVGTQQRSEYGGMFRKARELVRQGRLGKVHTIRITLPTSTLTGGPFPTRPVPPELNWDFWLGQAPYADYCPERCHHSFRWWYEYSGGIMTDWGAHHMDIAQWALGLDQSGPLRIEGQAEMPDIANGYNTPADFQVTMKYANDVTMHVGLSKENGILFEGDQGRIFVNRGKLTGKPVEELADNPLPDESAALAKPSNHMEDFFRSLRNREQPVSDVVSQHRSVSACHLANICLRLGRALNWDPAREQFVGDDEANAMLSRPHRDGYQFG